MNEAVFDVPDAGFVDHTVTYLAGTAPGGKGVLLLVERRPFPPASTLRQAVQAIGKDAATRFAGYRVLFERDILVGWRPALEVGARWRAEKGDPVYVRRVHLALAGTWLIFSSEGPVDEQALCDTHLDHVLATLRFRE